MRHAKKKYHAARTPGNENRADKKRIADATRIFTDTQDPVLAFEYLVKGFARAMDAISYDCTFVLPPGEPRLTPVSRNIHLNFTGKA